MATQAATMTGSWPPHTPAMQQLSPGEMLPSAAEAAEISRRELLDSFLVVHPGETLMNNGRYRPFRKIGEGSWSSVWLARDLVAGRYVAVKASRAGYGARRELERERAFLRSLRDHPLPQLPGKDHVVELLDDFVHEDGPFRSHTCLVFRPLGRTVEDVSRRWHDEHQNSPLPLRFARAVSIQALKALDYLHQHNLMHGDVHQDNLVLAPTHDIDQDSEADIQTNHIRGNEYRRPDEPCPLDDGNLTETDERRMQGVHAVLIDMGAANSPAAAPSRQAYPVSCCVPECHAPELMLWEGPVTWKTDIWALGELIHRLLTDQAVLPCVGDLEDWVSSFVEVLGPVPDSVRPVWPAADEYVTPTGELQDPFPEDERDEPLADAIRDAQPIDMSDAELGAYVDFMSGIFKFDPAQRSSTEELLRHPWVTDF